MKTNLLTLSKKTIVFLSITILFFSVSPVFAKPFSEKNMYVSVENVPLKTKASAASKTITFLEYASSVTVINEKGSWYEVTLTDDSSVTGWIASTALTKRKITSAQKDVNTDAHEIALAGKGFNAAVEESYSQTHESHFAEVDLIENNLLEEDIVLDFLSKGNLNEGE